MDELPAHIGPYEVRDRLGHGGMGVVYLGFDPMLDRPVAIKVLKVPDDETRRRFLREARLAARVHHPHIVSIYAVGEHEGNPYLAMEFIAGRTIAQIIRSGDQIPLARKVHWLSELCAGLAHAHESGIVHRDVKPSNLLIAQGSGTLRLVDFGIAHGNEASGMTMAGMIVGTPQYMSPEQITGQPVDARSDIFSVGTVAYELLTGRQAFGGDNLYHVSKQIVGQQPRPIESFVPDVPQALVKTIARCLQKEPAARAETARILEREFLAIARRLDPDHTLVVLPAEPTMVASQGDVTTSRRAMLREAEEAIEQGQLTTASGLLQKLESGTSPNPEVQQLRQKLQGRRLELRIHEAIARADEATQTGTIEEAEAAILALAEVAPRNPALERLRAAHQERLDERQLTTLTSRARLALQQDRLDEAEALIAEALALAPDSSDALAVQSKLAERLRAQRIARLVAQASRALDQEDTAAARKTIDALVKLDASRAVARLQARLAAITGESGEHAMKAVRAAVAGSSPAPAAAPATPVPPPSATPTPTPAPPPTPTPTPTPPPTSAAPSAPTSGVPSRPARVVEAAVAGPAAEVLLRQPAPLLAGDAETRDIAPSAAPGDDGRSSPRWLVPAVALVACLAVGGGAYLQFGGGTSTPAGGGPREIDRRPAGNGSGSSGEVIPGSLLARNDTSGPPAEASAMTTPVTQAAAEINDPPVTPEPAPAGAAAAKSAPAGTVPAATTAGGALPVSRQDLFATARQHASAGRYERALAAIDQVKGATGPQLQEERNAVAGSARQQTLAARRGADDLRVSASPQYVLGMSMQAQADRDRAAGRWAAAVTGYAEAQGHFLQAIKGSQPSTPSGAVAADAPKGAPTAPPAEPPPAPARPSVDLSTWSNEEARATIAQFCGAYLGRDIGGLSRLWPNMDPAWRSEFREAFATNGELVCVFESVTIVRTSDEFQATTRLLTQLPGGSQRRRALALTLVPARDRLVIGNIRVR